MMEIPTNDKITITLDTKDIMKELHKVRKHYHHTPTHANYVLACAIEEMILSANDLLIKAVVSFNDLKVCTESDNKAKDKVMHYVTVSPETKERLMSEHGLTENDFEQED